MKCFRPQQLLQTGSELRELNLVKLVIMQGNIYTLSPYSCYLPLNIIKG